MCRARQRKAFSEYKDTPELVQVEQPQPTKQPWEMTSEEWLLSELGSKSRPGEFVYPQDGIDSPVRTVHIILHKKAIQKAITEGKEVPENVLKN